MDKTSREFINYLIGGIATSPILLILLYRPEFSHIWSSRSYYSQISVNQLGGKSSKELVRAILEDGEVSLELQNFIFRRASGNPLFIEEFTQTLRENRSIQKKGRVYILREMESDIQVPDTIQGIIAARIDRLGDNLKQTIQVASVIGKNFSFRILRSITEKHESLKSYLLSLQDLEFIYELQLYPDIEYTFKHALTQEVAYNSLLLNKRKEIHGKIGEAIETLYSDRLEEFYEVLGHHYSKSTNYKKAYYYFRLSGLKFLKKDSQWEAFNIFKEAIKCLSQLSDCLENKKRQIEIRQQIYTPRPRPYAPSIFVYTQLDLSKKSASFPSFSISIIAFFATAVNLAYSPVAQYIMVRSSAKGANISTSLIFEAF